jgi:hypothetical protein
LVILVVSISRALAFREAIALVLQPAEDLPSVIVRPHFGIVIGVMSGHPLHFRWCVNSRRKRSAASGDDVPAGASTKLRSPRREATQFAAANSKLP